jgi:hypothetical protein
MEPQNFHLPGTSSKADFIKSCQDVHLDPDRIALHIRRVANSLSDDVSHYIPISDTCRVDNHGVISRRLEGLDTPPVFVSLIPAAGASSRYIDVFTRLINAAQNDHRTVISEAIAALKQQQALNWNLPPVTRRVLEGSQSREDLVGMLSELIKPKAFFPCVREGHSFIDLKLKEDENLGFFVGRSFVVSPTHVGLFQSYLRSVDDAQFSRLQTQGSEQSTIRIRSNGLPYIEANGTFSVVPAGHGTLASLIPKLKHEFPQAHSVLIRNIDNVIGCRSDVRSAARAIASAHHGILSAVQQIRHALKVSDYGRAADAARKIYNQIFEKDIPAKGTFDQLWTLLESLFHSSRVAAKYLIHDEVDEAKILAFMFNRPVNTLGQVPNIHRDVGGSPCFVKLGSGDLIYKICLEQPHASEDDRRVFLNDFDRATHFNPVFAFAEIDFEPNHYEKAEQSAWILSKKNYRGETVYYHESVLYELLGNSLLANVCFVEIPRLLFNPHKTFTDSVGRSIADWES